MSNIIADLIKNAPMFKGLSDETLLTLTQGSFVQRYPASVAIFDEGKISPFIYVLLEGQIERFSVHRGRELGLGFLNAGSVFIISAAITQTENTYSARTLVNSRFVLMPAQNVRAMFNSDPQFARNVAQDLAECEHETLAELKNQKLRTMAERLANWILRTVPADFGRPLDQAADEQAGARALSRHDAGEPVAQLRRPGALRGRACGGARSRSPDFAKLAEFAGPNPMIDRSWRDLERHQQL